MAYHACTGKNPFEGEEARMEHQIRKATPPSPIKRGVNVPRHTSVISLSCLETNPEQRPSMEYIARCFADAAGLFRQVNQPPFIYTRTMRQFLGAANMDFILASTCASASAKARARF
jgi:hypothetical protein